MAANLWLVGLQYLYEETDAHFILTHEMKPPKAGSVGQGTKE